MSGRLREEPSQSSNRRGDSEAEQIKGLAPGNPRKRPIEEKNGASCGEAPLSGASLQIDGSISEISGRKVLKKRLLVLLFK